MGKISFAHSTYIHPSQARNRLASKGRKITSKSRPPLVGGSTRSLLKKVDIERSVFWFFRPYVMERRDVASDVAIYALKVLGY